jgi:pyruvate/2-oxoglutarate dehydrogenase complex dihydrolipoamide acyltransferase (E2) component
VVAVEDPLVTLESDKATMDVPSPVAGTIGEVRIAVGDQVSQGDVVVTLEGEEQAGTPPKERVHEGGTRRRPSRPGTGRRPVCTTASRSGCPTSATTPTCR